MSALKPYIFITDIGSTTTKGILIHTETSQIIGIAHANTSVEEPDNDVKIGVLSAAQELEKQIGIKIVDSTPVHGELCFSEKVSYLSTSSAGGGLQILVIGLTLFDSGSSAKRAAYGAGGVILDVFAIDDKRKAVEQMQAMRNLRPDMILLCGGTDGGALSSVLRMAEILRIAKPVPKYQSKDKIPTLYAGNKDAAEMIRNMITRDFDLHIMPNLRPGLNVENLKPTQDKIQELFMENVMERAPGYAGIKKVVSNPILPTPSGVLRAMQSLGKDQKNLIAFDIGGATTDVFTRINGHFQRTVSANLGMSYSALNVLKEKGIDNVMRMLPPEIDEDLARNYIGNKSLYPTVDPVSEQEFRIEHVLAKAAIQMAYEQHRQMHYNTRKIGYLDIIKQEGRDKYEEKFHYIEQEESYSFYPSEIDILIGAGGVFAHAQNTGQCIDMLISGFKPMGITELMVDKHFISPHLGVLSTADPALSKRLLDTQCLQALALHIRPHFPLKKGIKTLRIKADDLPDTMIFSDEFIVLEPKKGRKLYIEPARKCLLNGTSEQIELISDRMIILDTRLDQEVYNHTVECTLSMYHHSTGYAMFRNDKIARMDTYTRMVDLPYKGEIKVEIADQVEAEDLIAVNQYDPARLFVIPAIPTRPGITEHVIRESIKVHVGDHIHYDQVLAHPVPQAGITHSFRSPVRARVEYIEYSAGLIVASEIQDYDMKPHPINIAAKLQVKPKQAARYLIKHPGDFVYEDEILARILGKNRIGIAKAPSTGQIVALDKDTGIMTIRYPDRAYEYHALVRGIVSAVEEGKSAEITYNAQRLEAAIGWGQKVYGILQVIDRSQISALNETAIAVLTYKPDDNDFEMILQAKPRAIICPSIDEHFIRDYLGQEQGVINTGFENPESSLILIQGFGDINYTDSQLAFLTASSGKACFVDPHTRIRAGVVRASIFVMEN